MQEVAEENGLDVVKQLADNPIGTKLPTTEETRTMEQEEKLSRRYIFSLCIFLSIVLGISTSFFVEMEWLMPRLGRYKGGVGQKVDGWNRVDMRAVLKGRGR